MLLVWVYSVIPVPPARNDITPKSPSAEHSVFRKGTQHSGSLWRARKALVGLIPKPPCIVLSSAADMQCPFEKGNENDSMFSFIFCKSIASKQGIQGSDQTYEKTMTYNTNFIAPVSNPTV